MDVNEQIVIAWLEECKNMFTRNNLDYGQFHSDIDVLAINVITNEVWDCEVKVRTGSTMIADNNKKQNGFNYFIGTFENSDRKNIIDKLVPKKYILKHKFITTKSLFGKTIESRNKWIYKFLEKDIDVIFFDDIIHEINDASKIMKKSTNGIVQTLRLLNIGHEK